MVLAHPRTTNLPSPINQMTAVVATVVEIRRNPQATNQNAGIQRNPLMVVPNNVTQGNPPDTGAVQTNNLIRGLRAAVQHQS